MIDYVDNLEIAIGGQAFVSRFVARGRSFVDHPS